MQKDGFRFVAYLSPPQKNVYENWENPECITDEHYRNMTECGFTYAIGLFEDKEEYYRRALTVSERHGVRYMTRDQFAGNSLEWIIDDRGKNGTPEELLARCEKDIRARFSSYASSPAYLGLLASDEPCADKFPAIAKVQEWFYENFPNAEFEVNLLPTYANAEQLSGFADTPYTYTQYLDEYLRIVRPRSLSYDFYALGKNPDGSLALNPDYLHNLELVANRAKAHGIPFYVFLLTMGHWAFRTPVRYSEIAWQVYPAMAYGCRGAQTFTYWTLLGDHEADGSRITHGVVGQNGEKTETYYACKEVIAEVNGFSDVYAGYDWVGCKPVPADGKPVSALLAALETPVSSHGVFRSATADGDALIGFFEGKEDTAMLVCNVTDPTPDTTVTVRLCLDADRATVYQNGKSRTQSVCGDIVLSLRGGGAAFLTFPRSCR